MNSSSSVHVLLPCVTVCFSVVVQSDKSEVKAEAPVTAVNSGVSLSAEQKEIWTLTETLLSAIANGDYDAYT